MFNTASFTISKIWNQLKPPSIDEWINTHTYTHTHTLTYTHTHTHTHTPTHTQTLIMPFGLKKKKETLSFAITWMKLEDFMLSEISQAQEK
jgi:hypothetical protein